MAKKNRAERRLDKFGGGRTGATGGWPANRPNPVFDALPPTGDAAASDEAPAPVDETAPAESTAGRSDQDQTYATGPGTGGATESSGRVPRHAGTHAANSSKG